jgi:hypothetical protein
LKKIDMGEVEIIYDEWWIYYLLFFKN